MTKSIEVSDHQYSVLTSRKPAGGRTASTRTLMRCRASIALGLGLWLLAATSVTETLLEEPVRLMGLVLLAKPLGAEPRRVGNDGCLSNKSRCYPPKRWCFAKTRDRSGSASI